ncbi:hypothetical protein SAMN05444167_1649 [Terriglobus roseus]|uniref:Uncharacterized protein n=1 Tax=Terriglobus roseus TaxID=392734 RepID=A0A1G7J0X5_9BACT|nr:hypothetical protein SAMN05444167_1649 [Terriglobus roseus]
MRCACLNTLSTQSCPNAISQDKIVRLFSISSGHNDGAPEPLRKLFCGGLNSGVIITRRISQELKFPNIGRNNLHQRQEFVSQQPQAIHVQ